MDKVINYLENIIKLKNGDTIVIGNSGGPDSMFLFTALLKLRDKYNLKIICEILKEIIYYKINIQRNLFLLFK